MGALLDCHSNWTAAIHLMRQAGSDVAAVDGHRRVPRQAAARDALGRPAHAARAGRGVEGVAGDGRGQRRSGRPRRPRPAAACSSRCRRAPGLPPLVSEAPSRMTHWTGCSIRTPRPLAGVARLVHAPAEVVAAERARVATEGWGGRLLALQGEDGQWARGACFPARSFNWRDENQGQPWISTLPTLQLLCDFGVDPCSDRVRRAVALVRTTAVGSTPVSRSSAARSSRASTAGPSPWAPTLTRTWMAWSPACWVSSSRTAGGTARWRTVPSARRSRPRSTSWKDCWRTSALYWRLGTESARRPGLASGG